MAAKARGRKKAAKKQRAARPGPPTDYNADIAARICDLIAGGKSLRSICEAEDMPARRTVFNWLEKHEEFQKLYAAAMSEREHAYFEEIVEIADDGFRDYKEQETENGTKVVCDHDHIQRARLRVDARKWALSRMNPKKYGDKTAVTDPDGGPAKLIVEIVDVLGDGGSQSSGS